VLDRLAGKDWEFKTATYLVAASTKLLIPSSLVRLSQTKSTSLKLFYRSDPDSAHAISPKPPHKPKMLNSMPEGNTQVGPLTGA